MWIVGIILQEINGTMGKIRQWSRSLFQVDPDINKKYAPVVGISHSHIWKPENDPLFIFFAESCLCDFVMLKKILQSRDQPLCLPLETLHWSVSVWSSKLVTSRTKFPSLLSLPDSTVFLFSRHLRKALGAFNAASILVLSCWELYLSQALTNECSTQLTPAISYAW